MTLGQYNTEGTCGPLSPSLIDLLNALSSLTWGRPHVNIYVCCFKRSSPQFYETVAIIIPVSQIRKVRHRWGLTFIQLLVRGAAETAAQADERRPPPGLNMPLRPTKVKHCGIGLDKGTVPHCC